MTSWSRASRYALAFTGALTLSSTASAACLSSKCSADLAQSTLSSVPVIVQYANEPSEPEVSAVNAIGPVYHRNHTIHTVGAVIPASQLDTLAGRSGVAYVSVDRLVTAHQALPAPSSIGTSPEFTAEPVNAPWAWSKGFAGQGIGIAVIDSGITPSADFSVTAKSTTAPPSPPTATLQAQIAALASAVVPGGPVVKAQTGNAPGGKAAPAPPASSIPTNNAVYTGPTRIG